MDLNLINSENLNMKKIKNLSKWEVRDNPLAPLDAVQNEILYKINQLLAVDSKKEEILDLPSNSETDSSVNALGLSNTPLCIDSTQEFLSWYNKIDDKINLEQFDDVYLEYYQQLEERTKECDMILNEIDISLESLNQLTTQYNFVSNKTESLHLASENLIQEQKQLLDISDDIRSRLKNFMQVEQISQRLQNPTFSPASEQFVEILNTIDECLEYMRIHPKFKEASPYSMKYKQCLLKAVQMIRNYITNILTIATEQVLTPKINPNKEPPKISDKSSEAVFALYYGKFQASSVKIKKVTELVEERYQKNAEYESLLFELHQQYLQQRALIMSSGVDNAIRDLCGKHKGDHCTLVRGSCAFLVHICQDEHRLFYQFFSIQSSQLISYMEGLCTILYDTLRPFIIHINHLETLAEICSILRTEMLEEHVQNNQEALEAFGKIVNQLLQDAQERLVFRAHLYLQSDILNYNPSSGDLAYPGKLEMMESIALSLQENQPLRRADSRSSMFSTTSVDVVEQHFRARTGNSPADLHGMWYPTVRRTLVCLSRLYRCVDRPIFQGLSQEALAFCIQNVSSAANSISSQKSTIDGELFEIKHLLILREQIAPFRVDFTVKETSLDFSKMRTAAFDLLQKRKQLFSMGSNNALLEFLLEGTPQVKENLLDSRKDVDRQLKNICEVFIRDVTKQLVGPILGFLDQAQSLLKQPQQAKGAATLVLRQTPWAAPQQISSLIQESKRNIKSKLSGIQRSMQLYLSNKDTEFILFKPIRNNIISAIVRLEQLLTTNDYSKDDLIIVSCPTADHISILISSASLIADAVQQEGRKSSIAGDAYRKISTSSMVEKKVSFDKGITESREEEIEEKAIVEKVEVIFEPEAQLTETEDKSTAL